MACAPEASLVRRHLQLRQQGRVPVGLWWEGTLHGHEVLLLQCGMGPERAVQAITWLVQHAALKAVLSVGFAGGLQAHLATGDAVLVEQVRAYTPQGEDGPHGAGLALVLDTHLVQLAATAATQATLAAHRGWLLSATAVVTQATVKQSLGRCSGAVAVDMESYRIGQIAAQHALPFLVLRTIVDAAHEDMPLSAEAFTTPDGTIQPGRLLVYLVSHPTILPQLPPMWWKARQAQRHLQQWLQCFLALLH